MTRHQLDFMALRHWKMAALVKTKIGPKAELLKADYSQH